jgi:hypothetical protein
MIRLGLGGAVLIYAVASRQDLIAEGQSNGGGGDDLRTPFNLRSRVTVV